MRNQCHRSRNYRKIKVLIRLQHCGAHAWPSDADDEQAAPRTNGSNSSCQHVSVVLLLLMKRVVHRRMSTGWPDLFFYLGPSRASSLSQGGEVPQQKSFAARATRIAPQAHPCIGAPLRRRQIAPGGAGSGRWRCGRRQWRKLATGAAPLIAPPESPLLLPASPPPAGGMATTYFAWFQKGQSSCPAHTHALDLKCKTATRHVALIPAIGQGQTPLTIPSAK